MSEPDQEHDLFLRRGRELLETIARLERHHGNPSRIDLSGVIQETLWEAHLARTVLGSMEWREKCAWLRRAFANNLRDGIRRERAGKRAGNQLPFPDHPDDSSNTWADRLADGEPEPGERAARNEHLSRVTQSLELLPWAQRRAIELHHLQGLTLTETARELGRTHDAVAGLLVRGIRALRKSFTTSD